MTRFSSILILGGLLLAAGPASSREPTQLEQYYLELVNRARANPNAEVSRLSDEPHEIWGNNGNPVPADLNEGITGTPISAAAKPPLAFDTRLMDSATEYSDLLLQRERFGHNESGTPSSRMVSAGYTFTPPSIAGENLAITASTGPHPVNIERVEEHHAGLFIDRNVAGRGHRIGILHPNFREVGIAIRADSDTQSLFGSGFKDVVSTQNFAGSAGRIFLTGVIYEDRNSNNFYDLNETAGILNLSVRNGSNVQVAAGRSFGSGGYSINLANVAAGNYTLVVTDSAGEIRTVPFTWGGTENLKVDLKNPNFLVSPVLGQPYRPDGRIGRLPHLMTGNNAYSDTLLAQRVAQTAFNSTALVWHARFENDGNIPDTVRIRATAPNRFFRVVYLRNFNGVFANVTGAVVLGLNESLQTGARRDYRVHVAPNLIALGRPTLGYAFSLRGFSLNNASRVDRVNGLLINRTRRR